MKHAIFFIEGISIIFKGAGNGQTKKIKKVNKLKIKLELENK